METTYRVYVLQNPAGRHYIGVSEDVAHRLAQHNAGESTWTAKFRPWTLVWTSEPMSRKEALAFERRLKRQGRGQGFYTLTGLPRKSSGS